MEVKGNFIVLGNYIENQTNYGEQHFGTSEGAEGLAGLNDEQPLNEDTLKKKTDKLKDQITTNRLWFPVCKYMMWKKMVGDGDFNSAVSILQRLYPNLKLDAKDLSSLNVLCFTKELEEWKDEDAPVHGNTFSRYYSIAQLMKVL